MTELYAGEIIILKLILKKRDVSLWIRFIRLGIESSGGLSWTR
jgi:hypothetical protein